ncbi:MAG: hypothetical protein AB3N28_04495 [Kordiimonas sp.]
MIEVTCKTSWLKSRDGGNLNVPHVTLENKMAEACLSDPLTGPLKGKKLKMQRVDAKIGDRGPLELGGE